MTTQRCLPVPPLRCWQYQEDAPPETAIPLWVAKHLFDNHDGMEFNYPDSSNEWKLDNGDWVVEFQSGTDSNFGCYTKEQFAKCFAIVPPPAEPGPTARSEGET